MGRDDHSLSIPETWSPAERWAWEDIAAGRPADFDRRYASAADPGRVDGWENADSDRKLSADFLKAILDSPYSTSLQHRCLNHWSVGSRSRLHQGGASQSRPQQLPR